MIHNTPYMIHGPIIADFVKWCEESHLQLNILKTKDMIIDFRKNASPHDVTTIITQPVQYVDSYKYLGTIIDFKLNFEENCIAVCKRVSANHFWKKVLVPRFKTKRFKNSFVPAAITLKNKL